MVCGICSNDRGNPEYRARDLAFGFEEEFVYFQCSRCLCLQIAQIPEDMGRYYPSDYYSFAAPVPRAGLSALMKRARDQAAVFGDGLLGKTLIRYIPNGYMASFHVDGISRSARIVDVGCGGGLGANDLRELGFENVLGIDPFLDDDIEYPNGLRVLKRAIEDLDGEWDFVVMMHAFEHVPDPRATLREVKRLLAPKGYFIMEMPIVPSFAWDEYGVYWCGLEAPRHFYIHSEKSVDLLAKEAGLRVERVTYVSTDYQFWGSEERKRGISKANTQEGSTPAALFTSAEMRAFKRRARKLNRERRGDMATFYLRHAA